MLFDSDIFCCNQYCPDKIYFVVDIDDCKSSPCLNGATCMDGINSYTCKCVDGYRGKNCGEGKSCNSSC